MAFEKLFPTASPLPRRGELHSVTYSEGERVRFVGFPKRLFDPEDDFHHVFDLLLACRTTAGDRPFDFARRIIRNRELTMHRGKNGYSPHLTELECGLNILSVERGLDAEFVGMMFIRKSAKVESCAWVT